MSSTQSMIVHLSTVHPRFDTRIFMKEAQTLASNLRCKVLLIVADGKGNVVEEEGRVSILDIGPLNGGRVYRMLVGPWRAFFVINKLRPTIVHFHDPELIPLGLVLRTIGYKVVYDVHEDVPRQILSKRYLPGVVRKPIAWMMSNIEWVGGKLFSAIVPATPKIAERFPEAKTVTIHNFPIITELQQSSPIPYRERPQSFVYTGAIDTVRGVVEIIGAASRIPGTRLDLAGPFNSEGFADTLRMLPGWGAVSYHGNVSRQRIAELLGNARAGLVVHHPIPNEIDALPIKMFEYMSAGIPIIASNFPVLTRIIEGARCGLLVDPLNPKTIEDAMRWILAHPDDAKEMGRRGMQAVERTYNWDVEATKIICLYEKLLAS